MDHEVDHTAASDGPRFVFCCRRCRARLFDDTELVPHASSKKAKGHKAFRKSGAKAIPHGAPHGDRNRVSSSSNKEAGAVVDNNRDHEADEDDDDDAVEGNAPSACTSYFLDPDITPWVAEESRAVATVPGSSPEGGAAEVLPDTIYCRNPQCGAKIGTQSWTGSQCSCGAWVTPAFKVLAKTVDRLPADLAPL